MNPLLWISSTVLVALCAVSCATVPDASDALARTDAVRISTAQGWLSYRSSQELIKRLGKDAQGRDFLATHLKVEEAVSDAPLVAGNKVDVLIDGPSTYDAMFAALEQAQSYIYLETYIFEDDEIGRRFAQVLADKRAQGVAVALMVDGVGTLGTPDALFDTMRQAGIQVVVFNPVNPLKIRGAQWSLNQRNHRKILVVDGKIGFTGGLNMSGVYAASSSGGSAPSNPDDERPWRDTHVRIAGPVVAELENIFVNGWREQNGPPLRTTVHKPEVKPQGNAVVRIIANNPGDDDGYTVYLTLMSAINSAQESVWVTMAYFVPDLAFVTALQDAARRGVDVVLVLPEFSDSSLVLHAGRSHYTGLLESGVKIYERADALLHAKTAVIDGVWSTIGSSNFDWRSFALNYEVNAVILGDVFGREMRQLFKEDVARSNPVTLEDWHKRGISVRMMELLGRMMERWL